MPFMQKIIDVLKAGGKIHLATNEKFYADEAREFLGSIKERVGVIGVAGKYRNNFLSKSN